MDIRHLRYFLAIVDEGSFTRAAARVNVAQPALSLHVRNMEDLLGTRLLIRGPAGVTPTEAGELLVLRARAVVDDFDRTVDEVRSFARAPSGTVRIGLPATVAAILAVPLIARCRALYPQVRIVIAEAMSGFVRDWLLDGRIDLAVVYNPIDEAGVVSEGLLEEELVLFASPGDLGPGKSAMDILGDGPLILPSGSHGLRGLLDRELRLSSRAIEPAIEIDSYANIKHLVRDGHGHSVLPLHAVAQEAAAGELAILPFPAPGIWRRAHLAYRSARPLTRSSSLVRDLVPDTTADLVRNGAWAGARPAEAPPPEARHLPNPAE